MEPFWVFEEKKLYVPQFHPPIVHVYQISELCDKFQVSSPCGGPYVESLDVSGPVFFLFVRSFFFLVWTLVLTQY